MTEKTTKFSELKERIIKEINSRLAKSNISEPLSIIDGFINQPIANELSGNLVLGGPSIPMVAAVGKITGQLYFFALKALITDIEI